MFNDLNEYCDAVLEAKIIEEEGLYLEEGYYDVEELCEYCVNLLENKADIADQYAKRRAVDKLSGSHKEKDRLTVKDARNKAYRQDFYDHHDNRINVDGVDSGDCHHRQKTAKDFKKRVAHANNSARYFNRTADNIEKSRAKSKEQHSDLYNKTIGRGNTVETREKRRDKIRPYINAKYESVDSLFNFDII